MRKVALSGASILAIALATGTAGAADMPLKGLAPIAPVAAFNWTGFYVGTHVGVGTARWDFGNPNTEEIQDANGTALLAGLHAGYNWQAPGSMWVFGIEGDWDKTWIRSANGAGSRRQASIDYLASVRGRLGMAFDRILVYGTAGVGWVSGKNFASHDNSLLGSPTKFDHTVLVVGTGLEWAASQRVTLRVDSLYYSVNKVTADPNGETNKLRDIWTVRFGSSYKF